MQSIVRAIESFIPSILSSKLILVIIADVEIIRLEDLHAFLVVKFVSIRLIQLWGRRVVHASWGCRTDSFKTHGFGL